jgi:hypothetical protein
VPKLNNRRRVGPRRTESEAQTALIFARSSSIPVSNPDLAAIWFDVPGASRYAVTDRN